MCQEEFSKSKRYSAVEQPVSELVVDFTSILHWKNVNGSWML